MKVKEKMRKRKRILWVLVVILAVMTACGKHENQVREVESQIQETVSPSPREITIYYQEDGGEYDEDMFSKVQDKIDNNVDEKEGKTIITLACNDDNHEHSIINYWITSFNLENPKYYVESINKNNINALEDIQRKLSIEVGTGGGPDILDSSVFPVSQEIMDSGVLVDLAPYMKASGITEEAYYPSYKAYESGDKVFGVSPDVQIQLIFMDENVLGTRDVPDMDVLLEKLLEYPKNACLSPGMNEYWILNYFLAGSEDVWGMVDWEEGKCDFSGERFSKILEVAKRYGANSQKGYEPVMNILRPDPSSYDGQRVMEAQGKVMINHYFEDGNYPVYYTSYTYAINSNTKELEGAWAFLSYIMNKNGQSLTFSPVHRNASHKALKRDYTLIEQGKSYFTTPDGQEIQMKLADDADVLLEELEKLYSNGRRLPTKAEVIHYIIYEETGSYFAGDKSKEEVIDVIESRVDLYLSELK